MILIDLFIIINKSQLLLKTLYLEATLTFLRQGSKLTLANSQNASDFDNLRVRKISTSKRLRVRIIHVSQTKGNKLLVVSPVCQWKKILLAKLCKCTKKITSSPAKVCSKTLLDSSTLRRFLSAIRSYMLHIPNSAEGNCLTEKENHILCMKSDIKSINLRITKYNCEKQSHLALP